MNNNEKFYIGAYGMFIYNEKLLVIKKARGPYILAFNTKSYFRYLK